MLGSPLTCARCSLLREQATGGAKALAALTQLASLKIDNDNSIVADEAGERALLRFSFAQTMVFEALMVTQFE